MIQIKPQQKNPLIFAALLPYLGIVFFLAACSQNSNEKKAADVAVSALQLPRITLLSSLAEKDKPKTVLIDTVAKPTIIAISNKKNIAPHAETHQQKILQKNTPGNISETVNEASGKGFFTTYTTDDGLGLDQVYSSYKDKWGNLWFGTNGGGVSKYDGKNFTSYTTAHGLANNVIWCITQDHEGNLWFGTDGSGVSKYDGESFTTYTTEQGLADNVVFSVAEDEKNNLWFGTFKGGVSKWDGKNFTNYSTKEGLINNAVKDIFKDAKGNLWFATLGGVSKWDGRNFTNYTTSDGLIGNRVLCIAEDDSGSLWFGAEGKGLSKYNGTVFTNYPLFGNSQDDAVFCAAKDKKGRLWFGTKNSGVIRYDGKTFLRYSTANGLANNLIRTVTEDEKNNIWFGSFGSGVCKFAGDGFTNFTTVQGLPANIIFSIDEDSKGSLWMGTSNRGVIRYNGKQFENFTKDDGLPSNEIYCVLKDHAGNFWFGTSAAGVSKWDGKSFTNYSTTQGLANNIVFSIAEDKQNNLWFGTSGGGVSKWDGKRFTNYTKTQGLAGNVVFSIEEDRNGNIWFGTLGGGVSKFDGKGFTNYTVAQGLLDNVVWTIKEDSDGNLWFGTQQGLSLLPGEKIVQPSETNKAGKNSPQPLFTSYTVDDGLPDNFITQVIQGDKDRLYLGTNAGMCELLRAAKQNSSGKEWFVGKLFNAKHGYPVKDVNAGLNAMFKDSKGMIWIGTGSDKTGLVRFDPEALRAMAAEPPHVFINQIKIKNEAVSWSTLQALQKQNGEGASAPTFTEEMLTYGRRLSQPDKDSLYKKFGDIKFDSITHWQPLPQNLVLPYYLNNVSFDYGAVETGQNFLVNYEYFLEGYDKEWSPATHNTYINFGNISEGHYVFKIKAQSPDGIWSEAVSYKFTVLPPWWRTWLLYAVYALMILAAILLFSRWRHRRILKQKKILEHKVAIATKQVREEAEKVLVQKKKAEDALSELKSMQTQLIQSEKMASLGELTAGIAHEIQNPLNFVNNFSEVNTELIEELKEELATGNMQLANEIANDIKDNSKKINHHGKRAGDIVKGMLQHSRSSSGQKEPTDINALADEYLRLAYHGLRAKDKSFNATMETDFDPSLPKINIVPQDIGRVILNLINNAFYAVTEKKKQQLNGYEPTVSVITKKEGDKVFVSVKDNGNGIPQKVLDKIFQPFFTTKPTGQGTGLGLSLSYDIVKAHGGELKVETKEGEGSEFVIQLPIV